MRTAQVSSVPVIVLTHESHAAVVDHVARAEHAVVLVFEPLDEVRELRIAELDLLDAGGVHHAGVAPFGTCLQGNSRVR